MLYPLTCAFFPVPTSTTVFIILNTLFAVSLDITFSSFSIGISILSPVLLFTFALTILGFTCVPPFAIVATPVIIWIGVISNLWPNAIVASSTGPTFSSFKNILLASPGKSIPVFFKNPNFLKYS